MNKLLLTSRALDDIQNIYDYSVFKWGEATAVKYIQEFENALYNLKSNKKLLKANNAISSRFSIYSVKKHHFICDILDDAIIVLTIMHSSMNILERLKKMEPDLDSEVLILFEKLKSKNR